MCAVFQFETLDEVRVYQRDMVPLGFAMTALRVEYFRTSWDAKDGVPLTLTRITRQKIVRTSPLFCFAFEAYDTVLCCIVLTILGYV